MRKSMWIAALWLSAFWVLSAAPAGAAAPGIGLVAGVRGDANVRHERAAQAQKLKFKDDLFWQDTLSTGTDSQLRLLIQQKSVITMKELTQLQLREDQVGANQNRKKSVVDLVSGAVRVVVDKEAAKEGDYEVRTNMAVAAIRGSDLYTQTGSSRVEFCSGPGSTVTATHNDPSIGSRDLNNLQCALIFPNRIEIVDISYNDYLLRTGGAGPSGQQNPDNKGGNNPNVSPPPGNPPGGGDGGGGGYNILHFKNKNSNGDTPPPCDNCGRPGRQGKR